MQIILCNSYFLFCHLFIVSNPWFPVWKLYFFHFKKLQKAIEGSTRSGVRLRPPLASFRDISKHKSVPKPPPPSSSSSSTSPSSPPFSPEAPPPSTASEQEHNHHPHQDHEAEVWIEGVMGETGESSSTSGSSSSSSTTRRRSCSYNSDLTLPPSSTPPPPPDPPPPFIPLSTLRPSQRLSKAEDDSDDEPMV